MTSMNGSFLVCLRNGEKFLVDGWLEHALSAFEYARSLARNQTLGIIQRVARTALWVPNLFWPYS